MIYQADARVEGTLAVKSQNGLPNGARAILAPLCGITNSVFRSICLRQGAEMVVTEMISSEAMTRGPHSPWP